MLSCVLNSDRAIEMNIRIIRVFTKMREALMGHKEILLKLDQMERKVNKHDDDIRLIFNYIKKLLSTPKPPRNPIGFKRKDEE